MINKLKEIKFNIINYVKAQKTQLKAVKEAKRFNLRQRLSKDYSAEELQNINARLLFNSLGNVGGDFDEYDYKERLIRIEGDIFTNEELEYWYNYLQVLYQEKKVKIIK